MSTAGLRSVSSYGRVNWKSLGIFTDFSRKTQSHICTVYQILAFGVGCAALGCYLAVASFLRGVSPWISLLAMVGFFIWLAVTPNEPRTSYQRGNFAKRCGMFSAIAFFKGISLAGLVSHVIQIDSSILTMALVSTLAIFGTFSAAALLARRRSYFYLIGIVGSATSALCLLGFLNLFLSNSFVFFIQVYVGLLVFIGWVCVDTQMMIEKAEMDSNPDAVMHALDLFIDMVAIFVRILIILARNKKKADK